MPKDIFDAGGFLESQGLKLQGMSESGAPIYKTPDGQDVELDVNGYLKSQGVPIEKLDVQLNAPDKALDVSPVGYADRAAMALGNVRGSVDYLKKKFQDVRVSEDKGIVVKNNGVWQAVDQEGMDPWEFSKDILEGAVGFVPSMLAATKGAAMGAGAGSAAGPVGTLVGGVAGAASGGAAAEGMRTSLGRIVGTYKATPEEQARDIAFEGILNAGGQVIGVGMKPALSTIGKAFKEVGAKAAPGTKDVLASIWGRTTGAGEEALHIAFDHTDDVVRTLGAAKVGAKRSADVVNKLTLDSVEAVKQIVEEAPKALTAKFGQLKNTLGNKVDDSFELDMGGFMREMLSDLEGQGIGKFALPQKRVGKAIIEGKTPEFRLLNADEVMAKKMAGETAPLLDDNTAEAMNQLFTKLNSFTKYGTLKGKNASNLIMDVKANINSLATGLTAEGATPTTKKYVEEIQRIFRQKASDKFHSVSPEVGKAYNDTADLYINYGDAVNMARRILPTEKGAEILANQLITKPGAQITAKTETDNLVELLGDLGVGLQKRIRVNHSAKSLAPLLPNATLSSLQASTVGAGGVGGAAVLGAGAGVLAPAVAVAAVQSSPRAVLKQVVYGQKMLKAISSLKAPQRAAWLADPTLVRETFKMGLTAHEEEEAMVKELLRQSGAINE